MHHSLTWLRDQFEKYSLKRAPAGEFFTLASGKKSSFYFDVKRTAQRGEVVEEMARALKTEARAMPKAGAVAGVVLGGCHLATLLSTAVYGHPLDVIYVRKEPKEHGTGNLVEAPAPGEGPTSASEGVIVVEDVFTTGGSSRKAIEALTNAAYPVKGLLVVLDRRRPEDRTDTFEGVPLHSIFKLEDFGLVEDAG